MSKVLSVRLYGKPVGLLEQNIVGKMEFTYLPSVVWPLSLSLPIQKETFTEDRCRGYFGGLLPEGDHTRKIIGKKYGINHKNDFSLLKAIGYDCAGAVSFHNPDEPVQEAEYIPLKSKAIIDKELAEYIQELPRKPLFLGVEGLRLSLAGVQDKAAVCLVDNKISLPIEGSPTTHIIKPAIDDVEGSIENEYLCLKVARQLGINVPNVEIRQACGIPYLLIERYDRVVRVDGTIKRIHQEDFCQAMAVITSDKYQSEGGPGIQECFDLLHLVTYPAKDRKSFVERIVFNFLIGNMDAHGKNFSILHHDGLIKLAPAYDILCTRIYDGLTNKMAMKIGGEYDIAKIQPRHWEKLCKETGYSYPAMKKILKNQVENIAPAIEKELDIMNQQGLNADIGEKILAYVQRNCDIINKQTY